VLERQRKSSARATTLTEQHQHHEDYYVSPGNCEQCECTQGWQACRHFSFKSKKAVPAAGSRTIRTTTNFFLDTVAPSHRLPAPRHDRAISLSNLGRLAGGQR